ncbi:MAG: hypothetical protein M5U12_10270 [Verrucomicrobia bacterium]|nr:hypothetical protein [Verrucomicrobiota bacterium]
MTADNFTLLAEDTARRVATYQDGTPTTIIGPPTSGARVLNVFWRDALGAEWRCTGAGTPGPWLQIRPAAVTADPSGGTIPTGHLVLNVTTGHLKRHAGGYAWTTVTGPGGPPGATGPGRTAGPQGPEGPSGSGGREALTANRTYYIATTGHLKRRAGGYVWEVPGAVRTRSPIRANGPRGSTTPAGPGSSRFFIARVSPPNEEMGMKTHK